MSIKKYAHVQYIFTQLINIWKLKGNTELAEHLGVPYQTLMAWKKRNSIGDYAPFMDKGILRQWLDTGEGEIMPPTTEYPHGTDKFKQFAGAQAETISKEKSLPYGVTTIVEGKQITPREERLLEIIRSSPEAASIVEMLGAMDICTRKDVLRGIQKEKLLSDLLKEKEKKEAA